MARIGCDGWSCDGGSGGADCADCGISQPVTTNDQEVKLLALYYTITFLDIPVCEIFFG